MIGRLLPYVLSFVLPLALALVLTPVVREVNRRLGMVDTPDARRINKVPIPRGGGVAVFSAVIFGFLAVQLALGFPAMPTLSNAQFYRLCAISAGVMLLGLADDRFSLPPLAKLAGQVAFAFLTWWWGQLGFSHLWEQLPAWADCLLTVFWIVGAVNAFNLIDGLDGLASGIALIAVVGMAGSQFMLGRLQMIPFYLAIMGGLLGFLRYNFNPASVFLGDSGSMFLGYVVATLPFVGQTPNSFLVSVGVPLLAMGVPIFDTSLAIMRRSLRRFLNLQEGVAAAAGDSDRVMSADHDHLHHRILRAVGLDQRRAAWLLYALAALLVCIGLLGMALESRAAGLWLAAVAFVVVVVFRDMSRIELFDAGRLLSRVAHNVNPKSRRRWAQLTIPFYLTCDLALLVAVFLLVCWSLGFRVSRDTLRIPLPVRVVSMFAALVFFNTYRTIWSRALISNYARLFLACLFGTVIGSVALYYAPGQFNARLVLFSILYSVLSFLALLSVRTVRMLVRDLFYAIDCGRLQSRKDVSRILVYGAGLRYRSFRRELVRTTSANERMIVGLVDDDVFLRGHYIGGIRVLGTFSQIEEAVNATNADTVVIACVMTDERLAAVRARLTQLGVKVRLFVLDERAL